MTDTQASRWGEGVRISPPKLFELQYSYAGDDFAAVPWTVEYELGVVRASNLQLGVHFGAEVIGIEGLTLRAIYRMIVTLSEGSPEAGEPEKAFQGIAARLAPVAMYPFVREALLSATQKALISPILLPIANVGALWAPEELEIPGPDKGVITKQPTDPADA